MLGVEAEAVAVEGALLAEEDDDAAASAAPGACSAAVTAVHGDGSTGTAFGSEGSEGRVTAAPQASSLPLAVASLARDAPPASTAVLTIRTLRACGGVTTGPPILCDTRDRCSSRAAAAWKVTLACVSVLQLAAVAPPARLLLLPPAGVPMARSRQRRVLDCVGRVMDREASAAGAQAGSSAVPCSLLDGSEPSHGEMPACHARLSRLGVSIAVRSESSERLRTRMR